MHTIDVLSELFKKRWRQEIKTSNKKFSKYFDSFEVPHLRLCSGALDKFRFETFEDSWKIRRILENILSS